MTDVTPSPTLTDLSGHGNALVSVPGPTYGPPLLLVYRGTQYVFVPGWDNKYLQSPSNPDLSVTEIDVRIDSDRTEYLTISPQDYNVLLAQPTTSGNTDGRFAVTQHKVTGICRLYWSTNGSTWHFLDSTAAPSFGVGPGRLAFTFEANNAAAGKTFRLYEQPHDAPRGLIDEPVGSAHWTLVSATTTAGTTSIHPGDAPLSISALDGAVDTTLGVQGWMACHRLQVRDAIDGITLYDIDPTIIRQPLTWTHTTVAAQAAAQAIFEGRCDEDWTITNFETSSYMVVIVDRTCFYPGNGSHGSAGIDDAIFDTDANDDLTFMCCYRWCHEGGQVSGSQMPTHKDYSAPRTEPGYEGFATASVAPGYLIVTLTDIANTGTLAATPSSPDGTVNTFAFTVDRANDDLTAYTDAVAGTVTDIAAIGSSSTPGVPFLIGALNGASGEASYEWFTGALWRRVLSAEELALVDADMRAGGVGVYTDSYSPRVYGS